MQPTNEDEKRRRERAVQFRFAALAFELGGGIAGCTLLGWWIDRTFGTGSKAVITCAIIGCVGGLYHLISQAYLAQKRSGGFGNRESEKSNDDKGERRD